MDITTLENITQEVSSSISHQDQSKEITLTPGQQTVHDRLLSYLTGEVKVPAAVLSGYAGVGKSTVMGKLIVEIMKRSPSIAIGMTAPTHKAVKVLRRNGIKGVSYRTIHSMLALKEQVNEYTGEISYTVDKFAKDAPPIADIRILILDECSMLQDEIFKQLVPWMQRGLKVIFTGDPRQIPPVKQKDCIPFKKAKEWAFLELELTEVMRQKADNPILELATEIRNDPKSPYFHTRDSKNDKGEGVQQIVHDSIGEREVLKNYFDCEAFRDDSDHMKVIAWRNTVVNEYNRIVRSIIYKDDILPDILSGEKLIMDRPFVAGMRATIPTNEELEVIGLSIAQKGVEHLTFDGVQSTDHFKIYRANVQYYLDDTKLFASIPIIHEEDKARLGSLLSNLRDQALEAPRHLKGKMWRQYYQTMEKFAWVKYNYAITAHRSQGSTYSNCLLLKWDIEKNSNIEERNRILYTACTRPRHILFIES